MTEPALRLVGHNLLDHIRHRILQARGQLDKGHAEWVEGSMEIALALREGRELMPADISFGQWLKDNDLDFFSRNDRMALLNFAAEPEIARQVLMETTRHSYEMIWREHKNRFQKIRHQDTSSSKGRKGRKPNSVRHTHRAMKLGEETMRRIKGTSLDRSEELDELLVLNRGAALGELTDDVRKLVDDAAAGKTVSAIAFSALISGRPQPKPGKLIEAFKRRMTFIWQQADYKAREALVDYLIGDLDDKEKGHE